MDDNVSTIYGETVDHDDVTFYLLNSKKWNIPTCGSKNRKYTITESWKPKHSSSYLRFNRSLGLKMYSLQPSGQYSHKLPGHRIYIKHIPTSISGIGTSRRRYIKFHRDIDIKLAVLLPHYSATMYYNLFYWTFIRDGNSPMIDSRLGWDLIHSNEDRLENMLRPSTIGSVKVGEMWNN